jgi:hypothetical protein
MQRCRLKVRLEVLRQRRVLKMVLKWRRQWLRGRRHQGRHWKLIGSIL